MPRSTIVPGTAQRPAAGLHLHSKCRSVQRQAGCEREQGCRQAAAAVTGRSERSNLERSPSAHGARAAAKAESGTGLISSEMPAAAKARRSGRGPGQLRVIDMSKLVLPKWYWRASQFADPRLRGRLEVSCSATAMDGAAAAAAGPTARGLVSEAEGTQPKLQRNGGEPANGVRHSSPPPPEATAGAGHGEITLPDGKRIRRPAFPPNPDMYSRVPRESPDFTVPPRTPPLIPVPRSPFPVPRSRGQPTC